MENPEDMVKRVKRSINIKHKKQNFLADVSPEYTFMCLDGRIIRNLKELCSALSVMTDEVYSYHWNANKKDFSNWVRDVIGDV
ncbi:hypothetical protein ACFLVJ_03855, partial [Chloroflexota bacterium]